MRRECRERFPRPPQVSDPDMHHGTCVTHVPWCMPGLLTSGFLWSWCRGKSYTGISGACATRNFTYLVRGPWTHVHISDTNGKSCDGTSALWDLSNRAVTFLRLSTVGMVTLSVTCPFYSPHSVLDVRRMYNTNVGNDLAGESQGQSSENGSGSGHRRNPRWRPGEVEINIKLITHERHGVPNHQQLHC